MGTQCLGPKKSNQQVYVKIIKSIHHDSQYLDTYQTADEHLFLAFYEKLNKQGDLRKFNENLSSRKGKIPEALALNYRLSSINKQLGGTFSGLIILNCICDVAYPKKGEPQLIGTKSDLSSNMSLKSRQTDIKSTSKINKNLSLQSQKIFAPDSVVDQHYFKLMRVLYRRDQMVKKMVMTSVNKLCEQHPGIIASESEVWGLINLLMQDLTTHLHIQQSTKTMRNLILRTKDQLNEHIRNRQMLQNLLMLWLQQQKKQEQTAVKQYCFQMLNRFFDLFVSTSESQFLCQSLFSVFDAIQFTEPDQNLLEDLCEQLLQSSDLKGNFKKFMFHYLLSYLLVFQMYISNKKWLMISLGINAENAKILYKNADKYKIKMACIRRMNAWIDRKYVDINQFHVNNNKILVYLYTSMLISDGKTPTQKSQLTKQLQQTLLKMTPPTRLSLFQTFLQQFQDHEINNIEQSSMFELIKLMINMNLIPMQQLEQVLYLISIEVNEQYDKKLEIIQFNLYMLRYLGRKGRDKGKGEFWGSVSQYLGSFYQNFVSEEVEFSHKCVLLEKHQEIVRQLEKAKEKIFLQAYYQIICNKSHTSMKKISIESQYCLLWIGFNLRKILQGQPIPERFQNLCQTLKKQKTKTDQTISLNKYFFNPQPLPLQHPPPSPQMQQKEECMRIIQKTFTSNKLDKLGSLDRKHGFSRCLSLQTQSQINSVNDRSFQDAFDIIQQR